MSVTVEQATTELRRRRATEELARRKQPDFGMIAIPRKRLPGVWDYDRQLESLLGDPDKNIEDFMPLDVRYDFGRIVGMTEKPDETKDRMATSLFYSVELGIPPRTTFNMLDELNKIAFDETIPASTAWGRIKQRYKTGKAQVQLMNLGYDILNGTWRDWEKYESSLKNIEKLQSGMTIDQQKEFRGFFEKLVGASAELVPFGLEAAKEFPAGAAIGGTIFGIGAALATAVIPTIGEEVVIPPAIITGMKIGAGIKGAIRVGELEAGGMFLELAQMKDQYGNKIDPRIAVVASTAVGTINGGIELAEWQLLLGTFGLSKKLFDKSVRKVTHRLFTQGTLKELIARKMLDYSIALSAETLQEIEQETTTIVFGELAKELNNAREGTDFKPITAEALTTRYREVTVESMRAFGLMVLPGTTISGALELVAQKKAATEVAAKEVKKIEVKAPVSAEKKTEAIEFVKNVLSQEQFAALDEKARIEIGQRMLAEQGVEVEAEELAEKPLTEAIVAPEPTPKAITPEKAVEVPYTKAGDVVDGRKVLTDVPNMSSIEASLVEYEIIEGIQEVPMSEFELTGKSYSASENKQITALAKEIEESGEITPLIVVQDKEGLYILEGGHRADALFRLRAKSLPAVVVKDLESLAEPVAGRKAEIAPVAKPEGITRKEAQTNALKEIKESQKSIFEKYNKQINEAETQSEKFKLAQKRDAEIEKATTKIADKWEKQIAPVTQPEAVGVENRYKGIDTSQKEMLLKGIYEQLDVVGDMETRARYEELKDSFTKKEKEEFKDITGILDKQIARDIAKAKPRVKPKVAKVEVKPVEVVEVKAKPLRQKIHAVAAVKGLTKKALSDLKLKHTGYRKLTGKIASKKISLEQLQSLLKAVQKARPVQVGYKKVITRKTEKKIQSLKENLIKKTQMTERHFDEILEIEIQGKEPKYIDAKSFITETQGKDILKRMLDTAEIVRLTESFEQAIAKNPEIADRVKLLDSRIEKAPKRDPYSLESMRYYNQQAQIKTGAPIFTSYMDLMDTHLEIVKTRTATWKRLENTTPEFKRIAKDEEALRRISDYIASQSTLKEKPAMPEDITADEIKLAKEIQKILEGYRLKVRVTKFYNWYYYNQPIPDHDRYVTEITKATDIYESKGKEELIEYLETQEWGVVHSGYEPLDILFHKIRPYTTGPAAVGKGHIKIRTDIEYHRQERNILQRLSSYMRQIDMLYNLSPKINAYIRLFDDNASKFTEWGKVKGDIEIFLRNLKQYNIEGGFFEKMIARAYSQAMRVIIMPSPVLAFRNLFQNAAFEHDKTILIDPRNTKLSNKDIEYLETYILQTRAMVEEYFMVGEKPLPGLRFLTKLIDKVKIYPYSDIANRHWSFWAKTNQVERALKAETTKQMMTEAKFEDMKELEQRRALGILARDGKEAMTQYIGRVHVDDIHFLYERSQRSPAEMTSLGKIVGNLMLFPRAYGEKLAHASNKMFKGKTYEEQWRGLKTIFAVVAGGLIVGSIYLKVTGRKRNPYNPLNILAFRPGGLAWGSIEAVTDIYANILSAAKGDSRALAALTVAIPRAADMFIPFYDYTLRAIEAATDQKNIDRRALRQIRMLIDKAYKIRGGAYKVKRAALEKWQYFFSGPSVEKEKKPPKVSKIKRD